MLITMGADLSCTDTTYANTALHWAVIQGNHSAVNVLIKYNAELVIRNRDNETPRDIATRRGDTVSARILERAERRKGLISSTFVQYVKENEVSVFVFILLFKNRRRCEMNILKVKITIEGLLCDVAF